MASLHKSSSEHLESLAESLAEPRLAHQTASECDSERRKRIAALMLMFGLWKGRTDIPADGLVFQEQLRSEE